LELNEATAGQLALVCCDCISAFVRDEVVDTSAKETFQRIQNEITASPEFQLVTAQIDDIPASEPGRRFCHQFFGLAAGITFPNKFNVYRKKARLMELWAKRIGVKVITKETPPI
jgi:hypothetical protein